MIRVKTNKMKSLIYTRKIIILMGDGSGEATLLASEERKKRLLIFLYKTEC